MHAFVLKLGKLYHSLPARRVVMAIALFYAALATSSPPAQSDPNTVVPPSFYQELRYRSIGPHRGGRVTAVAGVRREPATFYMGATGGGVWR